MKNKIIGILATVGPAIGLVIGLVSDWAANKEQERIIDEKVNERFTEYLKEQEEG